MQPHSSCLWHFPNPPCLHIHLRTRPFRHPAARACHNTWERESRRKQIADGGAHFSLKPRVKWVGAPVLQKESVLRGAMARTAARSKCHLHDSRAISGRAKQRTKNQLEQAGFQLSEMNSREKKKKLKYFANKSLSLTLKVHPHHDDVDDVDVQVIEPSSTDEKVHSILIRTR